MKINSLRESVADHKNKVYRDKFVINSKTATVLSALLVYTFAWCTSEYSSERISVQKKLLLAKKKQLYSVKTEQQFPITMPYKDYQQTGSNKTKNHGLFSQRSKVLGDKNNTRIYPTLQLIRDR
uniref:Uncharacterized protein n=1 Tax=Glossina pallidipes TaxID=7398 RepID=A0A1B0AAK0_GLOPL